MQKPKVSILTPAFNHEAFVETSIRSAWAQTHTNLEHVIVDDCSTDSTPDLVERLVEKAPIPTKFLRNAHNLGPGGTVNRAFDASTGDWVCFLASDDAYAPWKVERLLAFAERRGPLVGVVHADCWSMSETGVVGPRQYARSPVPPVEGDGFLDLALGRAAINGLGALIRRDVFLQVGGNDPKLLAEDFDFYLRLARVTRFAYLDEGVAYIRVLRSSLGRTPARFMESTFAALERQRDALGANYEPALRVLHLRGFDVFARYGPVDRAMHHAQSALKLTSDTRSRLRVLRHLALVGFREGLGGRLAPVLPSGVLVRLRELNRKLTQRTYR